METRRNQDVERDVGPDADRPNRNIDESDESGIIESGADGKASDEENLSDYDKTLADSFPASDPPAH